MTKEICYVDKRHSLKDHWNGFLSFFGIVLWWLRRVSPFFDLGSKLISQTWGTEGSPVAFILIFIKATLAARCSFRIPPGPKNHGQHNMEIIRYLISVNLFYIKVA